MLVCQFATGARGYFTRRPGGVSTGEYGAADGGGLNLGDHVGDQPAAVAENRSRLAAVIGATPAWMSQVHGCHVARPVDGAEASYQTGAAAPEADALLVIDDPSLAPAVLVADCVPVLLASESGRVRAAVHVGRRGLVLGVLGRALAAMREATSEPLYAAVGPHICAACYEVGEELAEEAAAHGAAGRTRWGTPSIDLAAGVRAQLGEVQTWEAGVCTLEDTGLYSYRRDGVTGRCAGVVVADTPN